jgi:tetratricopeptide (TPR) repeat protein
MIDASTLRKHSDTRLDAPLAAWRQFCLSGRTTDTPGVPADLREMARSVDDLFGWTDDDARAAQPTESIGEPASAGGAAGFYMLAEKAGDGAIDFSEASELARKLALGDDDIVFLLVFSAKSEYGDGQTAGAMMQLAAMTMHDDAVAGKLYRTLAALTSDTMHQMLLHQSADDRLAGGANDALRAEVWNEMAIILSSHGRFDEASERAEAAHELAQSSGASEIASMTLGNLAFNLMQQQNFVDALRAFEKLAQDQEEAGDLSNLDITRQNIAICRRNLLSS